MARDSAATQWCLLGAIYCGQYNWSVYLQSRIRDALIEAAQFDGPEEIASFNDSHTHTEVLALLDKAIEMSKPKE